MICKDEDGDTLEIKEVFGFGCRTLLVRVDQEGGESQMRVNEEQVKELIAFLQQWAE